MSDEASREPLHGNKLGLYDANELDRAARLLAQVRAAQGLPEAAREPTYEGFKAIHKHLFQDVYEWAGQERTLQSGNNQARRLFADPSEIKDRMEQAFSAFQKQDELKGLTPREFAERATLFVSGINEAHPFNDGNGRTQRAWLASVAERAGHSFSLTPDDREAWNSAARKAFNTREFDHMAALIESRLRPFDLEKTAQVANADRADRFLKMDRAEGVASTDPVIKSAFKNLDALSSLVSDPALRDKLAAGMKSQMADMMRRGSGIKEVEAVRAPEKAQVQDVAKPAAEITKPTPTKDRDR